MLSVTIAAKQKLKETLRSKTGDPEVAVRIMPSASEINRLQLVFDKEKEGDQVVKDEEGKKVLLIGSNLVPALEGMALDYQKTPESSGFTLLKEEKYE